MADQERPAEGRRRREEAPSSLGRPGEVLLWLLTPAGPLLGWGPPAWNDNDTELFTLRLPVALHQVPAGDGRGGVGLVQLYSALPVEEIVVQFAAVVGVTVVLDTDELAAMHAQAWGRRGPGGRSLVLPAAPSGLVH